MVIGFSIFECLCHTEANRVVGSAKHNSLCFFLLNLGHPSKLMSFFDPNKPICRTELAMSKVPKYSYKTPSPASNSIIKAFPGSSIAMNLGQICLRG